MESESLLEHDSLSQNYNEQSDSEVLPPRIPRIPMKYTSRINLEIGGSTFLFIFYIVLLNAIYFKIRQAVVT